MLRLRRHMEGKAELWTPAGTNKIMKFLISLTRGCSAHFCNSHVINVFSFVAHRGSGAVLRSTIT